MARPLTAMLALSRAAAFLGPSPHKKPTVATPMLAEREEKWEPPEFEENRIKARKRQERFSPLDKAGAARRLGAVASCATSAEAVERAVRAWEGACEAA